MSLLMMNPVMGTDSGIPGDRNRLQPLNIAHAQMAAEQGGYSMEHMEPGAMYTMQQHQHQQHQHQQHQQSSFEQYMFSQKQGYLPSQEQQKHMYESQGLFDPMQSPSNLSLSPSPPPPPRVYKPCVVCNDKSSGYHYGVSSCEGCKGFFRRSVQKNMQYTCHKDKNCPINKVTRNRCQYCRLQKCFAMGMSKEAVRNDRNKKKVKKQENGTPQPEEVTEDESSILQEILDAHRLTFPRIEEAALSPVSTLKPVMVDNEAMEAEEEEEVESEEKLEIKSENKDEKVLLWERVTELSSKGIIKIVEFAKKVPGFTSLSSSDQITLLKAACLEIMILRLCSRYDVERDVMVFSGGLCLDKQRLQQGGFGSLTDTIFSFANSLKSMDVDEMEFSALSAVCLISGDRSGLEDVKKIEELQEPILEALKHYVRSRRKEEPMSFAKLIMKVTDLRSISVKGAERVLHLRLEMTEELPPLIIEMLDRAENVYIP